MATRLPTPRPSRLFANTARILRTVSGLAPSRKLPHTSRSREKGQHKSTEITKNDGSQILFVPHAFLLSLIPAAFQRSFHLGNPPPLAVRLE